MKVITKTIIKNVLGVCAFILFCYLMIVLNLYKSTNTLDFNILKSSALKDFLVFSAILLPLLILIGVLFKRYLYKNKTRDHSGRP